jgi:hypothetical protein
MLAVVAGVLALVGVQFAGIVAKNVAMARDVAAADADIADLRKRKIAQMQTLRRLATPEGAVPEIHAKLRLVGPHEEIIFVRGAPAFDGTRLGTDEK